MNAKHPDRRYKSDRLNYIVNRMRVRQDITPAMLAEELHVSERTIYRDLLYLEQGNALKKRYSRREGRYMLETDLQLPPLTLTPSEALALFTAASNPALARDNFYAEDLRSGLGKLALALSPDANRTQKKATKEEATKEEAEPEFLVGYAVVSEPITVTTDSIQRPTMEMIRRAMGSNHKLRFHYWSSETESASEMVVAPYDLRYIDPEWLLLAQAESTPVRTYKISRMRAVEILPDRFRYPRRFSADSYFARALEQFGGHDDRIQVKIRFSPTVSGLVIGSQSQQFAVVEPQQDDSVLCTLMVDSVRDILWWILSFGSEAEALEPVSLRKECGKTAQSMAKLYEEALLPGR